MTRTVILVAAIALSWLASTSNAAVVTVFGVQAPLATRTRDLTDTVSRVQPSVEWAGTETASAIGPGESGRTKYEVKFIQSRLVVHHSGMPPQTIVSEPMTATFTHEQGGSILIQKGSPSISTMAGGGTIDRTGLNVECTLDEDRKSGICAGEHLYAVLSEVASGTQTVLATITQTLQTTYTGSVYPIATLTTNGSGSSATRSTAFLLGTVVLGAFFAL